MITITDEFMMQMVATFKNYTLVFLRSGPKFNEPGAEKIVREHARRNFSLRSEGIMPIVCPVSDGSGVCGMGIFNADVETTKEIMNADPGVMEGVFVYEVHPCRSFPGDKLP
jgi:hypothetical protein